MKKIKNVYSTLCFDIDNTICVTKTNDYKNSKPIIKNIKFINYLYKKNYYIKIFTARFMGRAKENINLVKKMDNGLTKKQLIKWGLKYHELYFGKPSYDLIVDDKTLNFEKNWVKDLKIKLKN
tara:strand:- start:358 stop:726 length:369 start_codon:yes stop_codon:yes gene_type:complete